MDPLWSHDLGQFGGRHHPEKLDTLWGTLHHEVSSSEVLLPSPHLLNLMDFRVHEANRGGHLLKSMGEVLGPLMAVVSAMCLEVCPPHTLHKVGVLLEASQQLSLRGLARGLLSFCLWWGCSSGETSRPAASSSFALEAASSWSDDWHHHLVPVGGASILETVGGEAVNDSSLPAVAGCGVVASMVASGTLPVRSSRGYISTP